MTAMDPDRDEGRSDLSPPGIFSSWWFRVLIAMVVLLLIAIIALPYLIDWFGPTPPAVVLKREPAPSLRPSPQEAPPAHSSPSLAPRQIEQPPSQPAERTPADKQPAEVAKPAPRRSAPPLKEPAKAAGEEENAPPSPRGRYMIQVGAFQDEANAARLAARLAGEKYPLQRATESRPGDGGGGHEVLVIGASAAEVDSKLRGTDRKTVTTSEGVLIQPALPLKEAVALSQELRAEGLTVKIRRAQGAGALHVVRVGAYPSRSRAEAVKQELEAKGYPGFIVSEPRR